VLKLILVIVALEFLMTKAISRQNIHSQVNTIALFSIEKQGDRILFGYGGDRLCKCSTTGRVIAPHQESAFSPVLTKASFLSKE
jgi:hypothetical protein